MPTSGPDYNYLLSMSMWSLTKERKDKLLQLRDTKLAELEKLKKKTPESIWEEDLDAFMTLVSVMEAWCHSDFGEWVEVCVRKGKQNILNTSVCGN